MPLTSNATFMSQGNCKGQSADHLPNAGALSILSPQGPTPPRGSLSRRQPTQAALTPPGRRAERRRTFLSKIPPAREWGDSLSFQDRHPASGAQIEHRLLGARGKGLLGTRGKETVALGRELLSRLRTESLSGLHARSASVSPSAE